MSFRPIQSRLLIILAIIPCAAVMVITGFQQGPSMSDDSSQPHTFETIMNRYDQVHTLYSREEVESLFGSPTERYTSGPAIEEYERVMWNYGRGYLPKQRTWYKWIDPKDKRRWIAVGFTGRYNEHKYWVAIKNGF